MSVDGFTLPPNPKSTIHNPRSAIPPLPPRPLCDLRALAVPGRLSVESGWLRAKNKTPLLTSHFSLGTSSPFSLHTSHSALFPLSHFSLSIFCFPPPAFPLVSRQSFSFHAPPSASAADTKPGQPGPDRRCSRWRAIAEGARGWIENESPMSSSSKSRINNPQSSFGNLSPSASPSPPTAATSLLALSASTQYPCPPHEC